MKITRKSITIIIKTRSMIKIIKQQKNVIFRLCKFDKEVKEKVILQFTDGKSGAMSTLDFQQANKLIKELGGAPVKYDNWGRFDKKSQQHKAILSVLLQLDWATHHPKYGRVADLVRFSEWLKSHKSPVKKPLMDMDKKEVSKIISALNSMVGKKYA
jgi:hypothetical protein